MKKLNSHRIGIDSGLVHGFSDFANDGEMWSGNGKRIRCVDVIYSEPFLNPPVIQLGFAMWDISNAANMRVELSVENVASTGFTAVFHTWGDTKIARLRANWLAIGEVETDEVWDV